jgi:uncharacterized LabA/DUF88 family protein
MFRGGDKGIVRIARRMSSVNFNPNGAPKPNETKVKVYGFIDGFNLYHALDKFAHGIDDNDRARYRKYKWVCLKTLISKFIQPVSDELVGIEYFTTYPTWDDAKKFRHKVFVSAQIMNGVHVTFGEFRPKTVSCWADCKKEFTVNEEKQTDVNIAISMIDLADKYDKLILLTADSDQVPSVKLLKKLHPDKTIAVLPPIGRGAKELSRVCDQTFKMTEEHLKNSQLPNPIPILKSGKQTALLVKPPTW